MGQVHQGQLPTEAYGPPPGFPEHEIMSPPPAPFSPQYAQFSFHKGKLASWQEVMAQQIHASSENIHKELVRMKAKRKGMSVQRIINEISSDNARQLVTRLVEDLNRQLWAYNTNAAWRIAAIEPVWKDLDRRHRQLVRIDLILKTEPIPNSNHQTAAHPNLRLGNPAAQGQGPQFRSEMPLAPQGRNNGYDQLPDMAHGPMKGHPSGHGRHSGYEQLPNMNHSPIQGQVTGQGRGNFNEQHPNMNHGPMQGQGKPQAMMPGLSDLLPPPPPPPVHQRAQHPPHTYGIEQQSQPRQQHGKPKFNTPQGLAGGPHQGKNMGQGRDIPPMPAEVLDPHVFKHQKGKPVSVPGRYTPDFDSESDSDSETDSDSDTSEVNSFSAESIEGDVLNLIRSRSRSMSRGNKSREPSRRRSQSRSSKVTKNFREKSPHVKTKVVPDRPPIGTNNIRTAKHHVATSPNNTLPPPPPQQIHIQVNNATPSSLDSERERGRQRISSRVRGDTGYAPQHRRSWSRDRHNSDYHEDRSTEYGKEHSRPTFERRSSPRHSPTHSPKQSYRHVEDFPTTQPMSRTSSWDRHSGTASYDDDSTSVHSSGGDSVFSDKLHRRHSRPLTGVPGHASAAYDPSFSAPGHVHSKHKNIGRERVQPAFHPALDRHTNNYSINDYPTLHKRSALRSHTEADSYLTGRESDDDSISTWPSRARQTKHNYRPQAPNPFDAVHFPAQRSLSYSEPQYPYYPPPKALPLSTTRQEPFDVHEIMEEAVEALREKRMNAYDHINRSQQRKPLVRSFTFGDRRSHSPTDVWANPKYRPGATAHRNGVQKARLADGRSVYVEV